MTGAALTLLFALLAALAGAAVVSKWSGHLDPAERLGLSGLVGLGIAGLLTLLLGLIPNGLTFALYAVLGVFVVLAAVAVRKGQLKDWSGTASGTYELLAVVALAIVGLVALVAVLVPSLATDWDTIAYHLAVPKLWLQTGQIHYVQGIHQSNFPSTMECLFLWGLKWGGQSGAKMFSLMVYVFGCFAMFGLARRWYGRSAGFWAAVAFAGIPVVAWESGTGYVDVAHGIFAALAAVYAVGAMVKQDEERKNGLVLAGVCLGFALGTKYTGLQTLIAIAIVLGVAGMMAKDFKLAVRAKVTVVLIALLVGGAWYVKTAVYTGNPVFPFFSSVLGGKDWDAWRASVYTEEQKSFGVGSSLGSIGHAVLGLAYQPGRYTNPGPTSGSGFPTGAIGFAALLGGLGAALSGKLRKEERMLLAVVGLGLLMWFVLSQQSRYLTTLAIPLALLGAGQVSRARWGPVVAAGFALQAAVSVYMITSYQTKLQLEVVTGVTVPETYLEDRLPFYQGAGAINRLNPGAKVALYDEVFGFYLDKPYFWANPGHSMLIPYEKIDSGEELVKALKDIGFTHVYLNLATSDARFISAMGYGDVQVPYSEHDKAEMSKDLNLKWRYLLADARVKGLIGESDHFETSVLYSLPR